MHHGNVATIMKQCAAFNKWMISPFMEVVFIDEVTECTLDIDDWKTLTHGGYSAHDVKYQTTKPFIDCCPMVITSYRSLNCGLANQPAIDRCLLTTYEFTHLPHPDKNAAVRLKQTPMDCSLWAVQMAKQSARFPAEEDPSVEDVEDQTNLGGQKLAKIRVRFLPKSRPYIPKKSGSFRSNLNQN